LSKRIVLLQGLTAAITNLLSLLADVDPMDFCQRTASSEWSLADVVCHLTAVERQYLRRLQRVLAEERPFLPAIHPNPTSHKLDTPPSELLMQFEAARAKTLALLQNVAEEGWERTAVHETHGEVTFQALVQFLVDHDGEHLNQIAAILQEHKPLPEQET
jgi:uncharacterized damage-inducible protein DinB